MKKFYICIFIIIFYSLAFAQYPGSRSLLHTHTGKTFEQGQLEIHSNMNFYTKLADYLDPTLNPGDFESHNMWLVAGNVIITYGLSDNLDITIAPRVYQDIQAKDNYNLPDDIFFTLKAGSFSFANRKFFAAGMLNFRIPTGETHNYPHAEFASGAFEYGISSAFSFYSDPYLPDRAFSAHLNLGWYNHNEAGKEIYGTYKSKVNSSELQYGLGFLFPIDIFEFMLEFNGISFMQQPDPYVHGRENWTYVTPSVRYKPYHWLSLDLGIDLRISSDQEETITSRANLDIPNYADWKAVLGVNLKVLPFTSSSKSSQEVEREQFNKRVDFFQNIIEERERVEDVQEELDKLKQEREDAEKELEELKQILEEEG